jgi:hypothetical protein
MGDRRWLETVRALLRQAEDPGATEQEREAFNAKARELMARKGIEAAQLAASGERPDQIGKKEFRFRDPYSGGQALLLAGIYRPLRCEGVQWSYRGVVSKVIVVGYEADLERVDVLYSSLVLQMMRQALRVRPPSGSCESTRTYRLSWLEGFAAQIAQRLYEAETKAAGTASAKPGGSSTALVIASRKERVRAAFTELYPGLGKAKKRVRNGSGYRAGAAAGRRADLGGNSLGGHRGALPSNN